MGLFSEKPVVCPVCGYTLQNLTNQSTGVGHFMSHVDDAPGQPGYLAFGCGCPEAVYAISDDWTNEIMRHLANRHGLKIPAS
jgi:hypothetical protein